MQEVKEIYKEYSEAMTWFLKVKLRYKKQFFDTLKRNVSIYYHLSVANVILSFYQNVDRLFPKRQDPDVEIRLWKMPTL